MKKTRNMVLCAMFTVLIIVGAFIKIPTPLVPITLQIMFTMMAGMLLGSRLGAASVALYVALGLIGIPVFANGGGPGYVLQPTFGYLIGFGLGAYATGKICEAKELPSFRRILAANMVGLVIVYVIGMIYYVAISKYVINVDFKISKVLVVSMLLPLPGDIVLCVFGAALGKRLIPIVRRMENEYYGKIKKQGA